MVSSTENFNRIFETLCLRISNQLLIKEINSDEIELRSDIKNYNEASRFVEVYSALTYSRFRITSTSRAKIFSSSGMKWICTYRRLSVETLKMSPKCPAGINIIIKKATKFNKLKDDYLSGPTPLRAVIKLKSNHSHVVEDPCSDRYLKVSSPVKECFYEYFKRGIYGAKAKEFHEQNLRKANFHALDDESMNPSLRGIYAIYKQWRKLKENVQLNRESVPKVSQIVQPVNVPTVNVTQYIPDSSNIICKYEVDSDENTNFDEIPNEVLQNFSHEEDVKPVLNIKKEVDDDNDGLPVIESYGSLAIPSTPITLSTPSTNSASAVKVNPANTQIVVYDKSSNTFKVVKCLAVGSKYISNCAHSSSQYNSYLPRTVLPPRVALNRV